MGELAVVLTEFRENDYKSMSIHFYKTPSQNFAQLNIHIPLSLSLWNDICIPLFKKIIFTEESCQ